MVAVHAPSDVIPKESLRAYALESNSFPRSGKSTKDNNSCLNNLPAEKLLRLHKLGVFRVEPFVFKTPPRTAFLKLSVQIRGKGTARIGGLRLTHSQLGLPVELANGGLESGMLGWSQDRENGSTVYLEKLASWQQGLQPSGVTPSGASLADDLQCICISNEEVKGLTILHYGETIPVYEGDHYSVQTVLSLEAPLGEGICIGVHFLNAAGQPLGTELLSRFLIGRHLPIGPSCWRLRERTPICI